MIKELDAIARTLADTGAGWVYRRDAAETLGKLTSRAVEALKAHADDKDRDVSDEVKRALGNAAASLEGIEPIAQSRAHTLEELVKGLEKRGSRAVSPDGDGYEVKVELREGRSQVLHIERYERSDGVKCVRVFTHCGPASERTIEWALRNNMSMVQCAVATIEEKDELRLIIVNSFLDGHITPGEMKACIKEIAFYGDWMEKKLTGLDEQ